MLGRLALANESTLQNDAPAPFEASDERFHAFLQSVEAGEDYRKAWEELLATIPAELALRAEWGSRESVGAAALLASVPANANVLVVGSGLLGTAPALALLGMRVTIADASPGRLRFVKLRFQHLQYPEPQCEIVRGELSNIPDAHFDLVVLPDAPAGLPRVEHGAKDNLHFWIREAFRSLKPGGECVLLASNRFGYKRYTGLHGKFERHGGAFLRRVFSITNEELTPRGYARRLRNAGFDIVQRYVPYVSHLDYHNLVNVAADRWPRIDLGPQERKNLLKSAGYAAGLFQWLAPSVLLIGRRPGGAIARETLLNKIIRQYFSKTKNPDTTFRIEHLLATRGNAAIALVKSPAESLVFRVPLCPKEIRLGQIHQDYILQFRKRSEDIKIPRARGIYQFDGVSVFVESREPGMNSSQHTGRPTRARTYLQLAEQLALLQIQRQIHPDCGTDTLIENAVAARARMVAGRMRNPSVAKDILQISQNCAELLRGRRIPAVVAHGDLRAKHCLILEDGTLTSMLDWGTAREPNLPLFDLIHFIIHDQKQQFGQTLDAVATRALHPRAFAGHEERAIRRYCELLQIDDSVRRACELYYPIEVAATAFLNWDYDRPHWVEVNFSETIRRAAQY